MVPVAVVRERERVRMPVEYVVLAIVVLLLGYWLDSVSDRTLECGCLVKLLWFLFMLGVLCYLVWFWVGWTYWAWTGDYF